ncbi:MAG: KUP/HAK/KT family potassium transporter, partial [Gallionellaceae bacterium]|nr:KUP/HAK/KT family potassium transporter [Gallionellaceae bacterium]
MDHTKKAGTGVLALAALGVVYGDIGTSPLYAFKEAFVGAHGLLPTEPNVLATLSALFWAMMLIISVKYVWVMLRFDNEGEGGVLALTALANRTVRDASKWKKLIVTGGIFAAALFYGDALITPAISVLSAVEGISIATPAFEQYIIPITVGVLAGLFFFQRHGTGSMGKLFGPITLLWFVALAVLGVISIAQNPQVLQAINPLYAIRFAIDHPAGMFMLLSAVFLALTGGEALYADMGHFGAKPVRLAWYGLVCPSLLINYFGQGALVLRSADAIQNPFYLLAPEWFMLPLVALATAATVIASQATITGAYSMTLQAMRMGYLPRLYIQHTSDSERGQIYIPAVNWRMMIGVMILVFEFGSSGALAAAYGIAVSGTMIITTLLTFFVALTLPGRIRTFLLPALLMFVLLELMFFGSNLSKLFHGGWMPLLFGLFLFLLLSTWKKGSSLIAKQRRKFDIPMQAFVSDTHADIPRVEGTAIYLTADPAFVPSALFHNLKHFKVLHEQTLFLHVVTADVPYIETKDRMEVS